jgi:enoyl-CoA hydratase/carnithine racemase
MGQRRGLRAPADLLCLPSAANSMTHVLESVLQGRVLRVTLNRPDKRNALNSELCLELTRVLDQAAADASVGAILLCANGPVFCAGMDLHEIGPSTTEGIDIAHEQLFTIGARLAKPIVAAVGGAALGGGTGLVANCHVVIASEAATFGLTEIRLGLWPFLVYRAVSAALGERRTTELALTGRIFGAAEARELGLIHEVAQDAERRAGEVAAQIAASSPTAVRSGLVFLREVRGLNWEQAGLAARRVRGQVFASLDFQEGIRAFREKRAPRWPSLGF